MKYIRKGKEPQSLKAYRETPGVSYTGPQHDWQAQLLQEQGFLCAYCMRRISLNRDAKGLPGMGIEHLDSRELHPEKALDWDNMVAVCTGNHGDKSHCDKTAPPDGKVNGKVRLRKLNPLKTGTSEGVITYTLDGRITAIANHAEVIHDIEKCLNLNDTKLQKLRKSIIDDVQQELKKLQPDGAWTARLFDAQIALWEARHHEKFRPYCQIAVWYLNWLKSRPRYQ